MTKNILREIRKTRKGTQQSVAKLLGKSQSVISSMENKSNKDLIEDIIQYADLYGHDVEIKITNRHRNKVEKIVDCLKDAKSMIDVIPFDCSEKLSACVNNIYHNNLDFMINLLSQHGSKSVHNLERGQSKLSIYFNNKIIKEN